VDVFWFQDVHSIGPNLSIDLSPR